MTVRRRILLCYGKLYLLAEAVKSSESLLRDTFTAPASSSHLLECFCNLFTTPLHRTAKSLPTMDNFFAAGQQFVNSYYEIFDSNRAGLTAFYRDTSMLTFEGQISKGVASIAETLVTGLPFQKVEHRISTIDSLPSPHPQQGGVVVVVTGSLMADDAQQPMNYVQFFQLAQDQDGGNYFIQNDIFRLLQGLH